MKKIAVLLLIFAINSLCSEIFECMTPTGSSWLNAVYIDGVLRGNISSNGVVYTDTSDEWFHKEVTVKLNFIVPRKYIVVKEYRHTGYLVSSSSRTGKALGYTVSSNHFFIDITKNEIDAVRAIDKKGRKCLDIDFIVDPDYEFVEYYEANAN